MTLNLPPSFGITQATVYSIWIFCLFLPLFPVPSLCPAIFGVFTCAPAEDRGGRFLALSVVSGFVDGVRGRGGREIGRMEASE